MRWVCILQSFCCWHLKEVGQVWILLMELEQAQSTVWVLSFHIVLPLVLSVFCNLFFKLTLEGLHVLTLNQSLYLSIFFSLTLSSGCNFEEFTLIFLAELSLKTQHWI